MGQMVTDTLLPGHAMTNRWTFGLLSGQWCCSCHQRSTSDAGFNLGCAIGLLQSLPPRVSIAAMSGQVFDVAEVQKNRLTHRFQPVSADRMTESAGTSQGFTIPKKRKRVHVGEEAMSKNRNISDSLEKGLRIIDLFIRDASGPPFAEMSWQIGSNMTSV